MLSDGMVTTSQGTLLSESSDFIWMEIINLTLDARSDTTDFVKLKEFLGGICRSNDDEGNHTVVKRLKEFAGRDTKTGPPTTKMHRT